MLPSWCPIQLQLGLAEYFQCFWYLAKKWTAVPCWHLLVGLFGCTLKLQTIPVPLVAYWTALTDALINLVLPTTTMQWFHLTFWNCTLNPVVIYTHSLVLIHNYQYQCELLNALIDRKTAIYHATIQHLLALFRKQCPLVAQAWWQ